MSSLAVATRQASTGPGHDHEDGEHHDRAREASERCLTPERRFETGRGNQGNREGDRPHRGDRQVAQTEAARRVERVVVRNPVGIECAVSCGERVACKGEGRERHHQHGVQRKPLFGNREGCGRGAKCRLQQCGCCEEDRHRVQEADREFARNLSKVVLFHPSILPPGRTG